MFAALRVAELCQRLRFDLANAFACHPEGPPNFFERARPAVVETEPQANDLLFSLAQLSEHLANLDTQHFAGGSFGWPYCPRVFDEVGEADVILGTNRSCLLYTSPSPRDQRGSRMPSSA